MPASRATIFRIIKGKFYAKPEPYTIKLSSQDRMYIRNYFKFKGLFGRTRERRLAAEFMAKQYGVTVAHINKIVRGEYGNNSWRSNKHTSKSRCTIRDAS